MDQYKSFENEMKQEEKLLKMIHKTNLTTREKINVVHMMYETLQLQLLREEPSAKDELLKYMQYVHKVNINKIKKENPENLT